MTETIHQTYPKKYHSIEEATKLSGFTMASDVLTCSLLRTLASSKPAGKFLELGTGTGLSTSWILDGMDEHSALTSIDNDPKFLEIAQSFLGNDRRLKLICTDGSEWVEKNNNQKYDYIFADTWHGKYLLLEEVLSMLNKGGLYIIDDMLPQPNWPDGDDYNPLESRQFNSFITNLQLAAIHSQFFGNQATSLNRIDPSTKNRERVGSQ